MSDSWRPHIESALCLDLRRMMRARAIVPGCESSGAWQWTRDGERVASIGYRAAIGMESGTLTLSYRDEGQDAQDVILLTTVPNHYGGRNWFMHCPATGRRARKLYKWAGLAHFRHREAVRPRPTYASQRDSGSNRVMRQRWALRQKMGDQWSDLFGEPFKPKWMRWQTYERYARRDAELEAREAPAWTRLLGRLGVGL